MERIFLSSSADLRDLRASISQRLGAWLREHGFRDMVQPYLWEAETEDGRLLSDRARIQTQLPDPFAPEILLTICMFGERCGNPLEDTFAGEYVERLKAWQATDEMPGFLHPWPRGLKAARKALDRGCFPLTGTVFELLSAHLKNVEEDNLIVGYVASVPIGDDTAADDVNFNNRRLWNRLVDRKTKAESDKVAREIYDPQIKAVLNLIRFLSRTFRFVDQYESIDKMQRVVIERAEAKLRTHLRIASLRNPFKSNLIHWTIDDLQELPGRLSKVKTICAEMKNAHDTLVLLKGRSGCGKSSMMQRGVLAHLRKTEDALVLAFRPTDLGDGLQQRPDRLSRLWTIVADVVNVPGQYDGGAVWQQRPINYAKRLSRALHDRRSSLVIGIDQFEEVIDELKLSKGQGERLNRWAPVLRFLRELSASPDVRVIGTLEASREQSFRDCKVEEAIGLKRKVMSVEIGPDEVAEIARDGFAQGGLPLDDLVLEAIKTRWTTYEADDDARSASPLPMACLFFNRLYERFEHRAGATAEDRLKGQFGRAEAGAADTRLTLDDIGGEEAIAFEDIIQKLADEAWRATAGSSSFSDPIERDQQFRALNNFLSPCVGADDGAHIRVHLIADESFVEPRRHASPSSHGWRRPRRYGVEHLLDAT